jgi:hypothetical protein
MATPTLRIALVVAIALLLRVRSDIQDLRADIKEERQERRQALTTITGELRTAIPDAGAFAGPICPPAVKADAIGADGLPPAGSDVEVLEHVDELLRSNEQKIRGAFLEVEGLAIGAGRGRASVRDHSWWR